MRAIALMLALLATAPSQTTQARRSAQTNSAQKTPSTGNPPQRAQESIVFWNMSPHYVDSLLDHVPQPDPLRLSLLNRVFLDLQCKGAQLREQRTRRAANLLCTLPAGTAASGPDPYSGTILFIAHYEHEGPGQSAIENWSGAVMLPFLFHALSAMPRHHTFLFAEVSGAEGAKTFYDSLAAEQRHAIRGVISLDALGLGPAQFYISSFDSERYYAWLWLYRELFQASVYQRVPAPAAYAPSGWLKVDTTTEFRHHGSPSILIHSVPSRMSQLPGSLHDEAAAIIPDAYSKNLTLLSYYAVLLDQSSPAGITQLTPAPHKGSGLH